MVKVEALDGFVTSSSVVITTMVKVEARDGLVTFSSVVIWTTICRFGERDLGIEVRF